VENESQIVCLCRSLVPAADLNARITAQLIRQRSIPVPLHLLLVNRQDVALPRSRDDVAFAYPLLQVRARHGDVLVVGIIFLTFQLDLWPIGHGGAESQRANSHTQ
jgi:hypothetical protein